MHAFRTPGRTARAFAIRVALLLALGLALLAPGAMGCNCDGDPNASDASDASDAFGASDGASGSDGATGSDGASGSDGGGASDSGTASPGCDPGAVIPPIDEHRTLLWDGTMREFDLHVPASYDRSPTPLVFDFHGYTFTASLQESYSMLNPKADAEGFIAVTPDGTGLLQGWNAGDCCGSAAAGGVDDVGFVNAMIDVLSAELCIDAARVFATGFSNGGFLSHRLACELGDRFAAIAPVAGVLGVDPCTPARPMPVMHFHGDADPVVPYDGSPAFGFISVAETIDFWVVYNGCSPAPTTTFMMGDSQCDTYGGCADGADVVLCTISGGGHTWPGGGPGITTMDLYATDAMWDFFVAHPMP